MSADETKRNSDDSGISTGVTEVSEVSVVMADAPDPAKEPVGKPGVGAQPSGARALAHPERAPAAGVLARHQAHLPRADPSPEPDDLCSLPEMDSQSLADAFDRDWAAERAKDPDSPSSCGPVLVGSRPVFLGTALLYATAQATLFSGPVLLRLIVEAIECNAAGGDNCASKNDTCTFTRSC